MAQHNLWSGSPVLQQNLWSSCSPTMLQQNLWSSSLTVLQQNLWSSSPWLNEAFKRDFRSVSSVAILHTLIWNLNRYFNTVQYCWQSFSLTVTPLQMPVSSDMIDGIKHEARECQTPSSARFKIGSLSDFRYSYLKSKVDIYPNSLFWDMFWPWNCIEIILFFK